LDATLVDWGSGRTMHRVHDAAYAANLFNPSPTGNARFSPIRDEDGEVIPTLYAATTPRGALMETIFHDVPYKPSFKRVSTSRMAGKLHSTLAFHVDFRLVDLSRVALRKLGVPRQFQIGSSIQQWKPFTFLLVQPCVNEPASSRSPPLYPESASGPICQCIGSCLFAVPVVALEPRPPDM